MKKLIKKIAVVSFTIFAFATVAMAQKSDKQTVTIVLQSDLHCHSCADKVMNTLPYKKGIKDVLVDVATKVITVQYDPTKSSTEEVISHLSKVSVKAEEVEKKAE